MADVSMSLIVIRSSDIERSVGFYSALGLKFTIEKHGSGPEHFACKLDGLVFEIYPQENGIDVTSCRLGFRVPSIESTLTALEAAGGKIITPAIVTRWGKRAVVIDPDGYYVELLQSSA